jgi:hypothetical protein
MRNSGRWWYAIVGPGRAGLPGYQPGPVARHRPASLLRAASPRVGHLFPERLSQSEYHRRLRATAQSWRGVCERQRVRSAGYESGQSETSPWVRNFVQPERGQPIEGRIIASSPLVRGLRVRGRARRSCACHAHRMRPPPPPSLPNCAPWPARTGLCSSAARASPSHKVRPNGLDDASARTEAASRFMRSRIGGETDLNQPPRPPLAAPPGGGRSFSRIPRCVISPDIRSRDVRQGWLGLCASSIRTSYASACPRPGAPCETREQGRVADGLARFRNRSRRSLGSRPPTRSSHRSEPDPAS